MTTYVLLTENPQSFPGGGQDDAGRPLHGEHRVDLQSVHQFGHRDAGRGIRKGSTVRWWTVVLVCGPVKRSTKKRETIRVCVCVRGREEFLGHHQSL